MDCLAASPEALLRDERRRRGVLLGPLPFFASFPCQIGGFHAWLRASLQRSSSSGCSHSTLLSPQSGPTLEPSLAEKLAAVLSMLH